MEGYKQERQDRIAYFRSCIKQEESDRLQQLVQELERGISVESEQFEDCLALYFDTMICFLEVSVQRFSSFSKDALMYSQIVEEIYLWDCFREKKADIYHISETNPIRMMNKRLEIEVAGFIEKDANCASATEKFILQSIFEEKNKNRNRLKLFCRNRVYEACDIDDKSVKGEPFEKVETNTEIPVIRLWEKLEHYKANCGTEKVKVAVFGQLTDTDGNQKELLQKLSGLSIEWTMFMHMPEIGEYYFADETGQQVYDLLNLYDLQKVADAYQIILFLDLNCFYRQRQSDKTAEEGSEGVNCRWYFNMAQSCGNFKDKAAYYQAIYDHVGMWINSLYENKSAFFEFDERVYRNLRAVSKPETDIYLYVKYGNKIGINSLEYNDICNDEYYSGKQLTVCKITQFDNVAFNQAYRDFLDKGVQFDDLHVNIKIWKLLKSISNQYCDEIMCRYGASDAETQKILLESLRSSYLVLRYEIDAERQEIKIKYQLALKPEIEGDLKAVINDMAETILKYAFGQGALYCINRYFKELMIHSVISNANDMADLVFAQLLSQNWISVTECVNEDTDGFHEQVFSELAGQRFRVRKVAYAIIERLERLRMRSIPDMRGYFLSSFRVKTCPDLDDENMVKTFHMISKCCEHFENTGSSLYVNSKLIDER